MDWNIIRGLESLGRGCPFYKHSRCDEVPWPRVNNIIGEEQYKREIERLNSIALPGSGEIISHHISTPSRVTYTSRLPFFKLSGDELQEYVICDASVWSGSGNIAPGSCMLTGIRVRAPLGWRFEKVRFYMSGGIVQNLTWELLKFMESFLGMKFVEEDDEECLITLPLFFSRDPTYAIPLFVVGEIKISVSSPDPLSGMYADLTILHTREEIKQIKLKHVLRTDHHAERRVDGTPIWFYISCFWRDLGESVETVRIDYDGSKDEEIKGVFWEILDDTNVSVKLYYRFSDGDLVFIDNLPQNLVSRSELARMVPSMVGGSRSYTGRNYGGFMFSSYYDDGDCSPGITPRNGELMMEFSKPVRFRTYVFSSRDWINYHSVK
jgi:hypothetical protein